MTRTVAVVGAGISGLAAAARLAESAPPDTAIVVLEATDRIGGKLRREQVAGVWVDVGAEALLARRPEGLALIERAGLSDQLIHPRTTSALLRGSGVNHALPKRTVVGVPGDVAALAQSGAVSTSAVRAVAAEPELPPIAPLDDDIAVGELVAERFGAEIVDRLVDPLLGGVYAGRAGELSLQATIPALAQRLRAGGSLLAAAAALAGGAGDLAASGPVFASLTGGLASLPEALAARLTVRRSSTVRSVERHAAGFRLVLGSAASATALDVDAVILATPAGKTASLLRDVAPAASTELSRIETASMAIVTLAFRRQEVALPGGSGVLVPAVEPLQTKAFTFSSQKWPGVGDDEGVLLLRGSLGRVGEPAVLQREDSELVATVRRDLEALAGVRAQPLDSHVQRWGGGLPQYAVGHVARVGRIRAAVASVAGLAVCGASYDGVGIAACIATAHTAADQIAAGLYRSAQ